MDVKIIAALISLSGIAVAALFSAFGYYHKTKQERLRTNRRVIYLLLKVRHAVRTELIDPENMYQQYLSYCKKIFAKYNIEMNEIPDDMDEFMRNHFHNMAKAVQTNIDESILNPLSESLFELAHSNPTLAFQLNSNENLGKLLHEQSDYINALTQSMTFQQQESIQECLESQASNANNQAIEDLIKDIDSDINKVALSCDLVTLYKCSKFTAQKAIEPIDFKELGLDKFLDTALSEVVKVHKHKNKSHQPA